MNGPSDSQAGPSAIESSHFRQGFLLVAWVALWMGAQGLMTSMGLGTKAQVGFLLLGLCGVFGGAFLRWRSPFLGLLTSLSFAVSQILFMGLVVAVGTFVPQAPLLMQISSSNSWVQALQLGDVFHGLWFLALLALLSLSMLAVAWKRRPYSLAKVGFLMVHAAPTLVLIGGLWGQLAGVKAWADLKVGQGTYRFHRLRGVDSDKAFVLPGFQVRLERLEVQRPGAEVRLQVSAPKAERDGTPRPAEFIPVVEGHRGRLLDTGLEFEVERLIPGALAFGDLPVPPAEARDPDVLVVLLGVGSPDPLLGVLHAFGGEEFRKDEPQGRFAVLFREQLDEALLATLRPRPARIEKMVATFGDRRLEIPAKVGERLVIGDALLKVVTVYPDFQVRQDGAGNPVMSSRSAEPRDPWLEVEMVRPGSAPRRVLLSAREPDYSDRLNAANLPRGLGLRYLRAGGETLRRFVVFSRVERRVALVESGIVVRQGAWDLNRPFVVAPGLSVTPVGLFDRYYLAPKGVEKGAAPALRVRVVDPWAAQSERAWLTVGGRDRVFFGGRVALSLPEDLDPKHFRSTLVITDPYGHELARQEVGVNQPLVYGGLAFLQSPHPPQDPEVSAIMVVDEPGAWVAWIGYGMLMTGTAWMFFLKPWLKRRAQRGDQ